MTNTNQETTQARAAFVRFIKKEDYDADRYFKHSLRQHWNGAASGFHDHQVQRRWKDFLAGWQAAKGIIK